MIHYKGKTYAQNMYTGVLRRKRCRYIESDGRKCSRLAEYHKGWQNYRDVWYCRQHNITVDNEEFKEKFRQKELEKLLRISDIIREAKAPQAAAEQILSEFTLYKREPT